MTTALKIIERAFQKATIKAAETPLSASEIEDGLDALNDLLSRWDSTGVLIGIPRVADVNDDLQEPEYATAALKAKLATIMCGEYALPITQGLAVDVSEAVRDLVIATANTEDVAFPSTLPRGSGNPYNYGTGYDSDFFPENKKRNF
jgi:hypothetical protein